MCSHGYWYSIQSICSVRIKTTVQNKCLVSIAVRALLLCYSSRHHVALSQVGLCFDCRYRRNPAFFPVSLCVTRTKQRSPVSSVDANNKNKKQFLITMAFRNFIRIRQFLYGLIIELNAFPFFFIVNRTCA